MNVLQLSKRLATVASYVPAGSTIADIGSDHAYLPAYLVLNEIAPFAVAGEVNLGPYLIAQEQVKKNNLTDKISVRKGNGLEVIRPHEVDVITIAGMGGALITEILETGNNKLAGVKRIILQPNVMAEHIRIWLKANDWMLIAEEIMEEDEKTYEILVAEKGNGERGYSPEKLEAQLMLGPYLMSEKNKVFQKKWRAEMESWKKIVATMEQAKKTETVLAKKRELIKKINIVEEVLANE